MASYVFENAKKLMAYGTLKFDNPPANTYRIALVNASPLDVAAYNTKTLWSDIKQFEITNITGYNITGYETQDNFPGKALTNVGYTVGNDIDSDGVKDGIVYADNIIYNLSTITADGAIIMKSKVGSVDYDLICALDFRGSSSSPVNSTNGAFTIKLNLNSGGFLTIK